MPHFVRLTSGGFFIANYEFTLNHTDFSTNFLEDF